MKPRAMQKSKASCILKQVQKIISIFKKFSLKLLRNYLRLMKQINKKLNYKNKFNKTDVYVDESYFISCTIFLLSFIKKFKFFIYLLLWLFIK